MTVRVDDVRGVAGFVLPGDRVDVVLIRTEAVASAPKLFRAHSSERQGSGGRPTGRSA